MTVMDSILSKNRRLTSATPAVTNAVKYGLKSSFYPLYGGGVAEVNRALRKGYTMAKILEIYSMMHRDSDASRVRKASRPNMSG